MNYGSSKYMFKIYKNDARAKALFQQAIPGSKLIKTLNYCVNFKNISHTALIF